MFHKDTLVATVYNNHFNYIFYYDTEKIHYVTQSFIILLFQNSSLSAFGLFKYDKDPRKRLTRSKIWPQFLTTKIKYMHNLHKSQQHFIIIK